MALTKTEKKLKQIAEELLGLYINAQDVIYQDWDDYEKSTKQLDKEALRWKKKINRACGIEDINKEN